MAERTATIASTTGLHARPANVFVQAAKECGLPVTIGLPGSAPVNAASILSVMGLAATQGTQVVLSAEGDGAEDVLDQLVAVLQTNHDDSGAV